MIRRPPRSTLFPYTDALPIWFAFLHQRADTQEDSLSVGDCVVLGDRKSTRLNSSHLGISYAVFCLKKKIEKDEVENCIIAKYYDVDTYDVSAVLVREPSDVDL